MNETFDHSLAVNQVVVKEAASQSQERLLFTFTFTPAGSLEPVNLSCVSVYREENTCGQTNSPTMNAITEI